MTLSNSGLEQVDRKIATLLMNDATLTSTQLGELVGLSASATNEQVRKLKSEGAIRRIAAVVESHFMQFSLGAFIFVLVGGKDNNVADINPYQHL